MNTGHAAQSPSGGPAHGGEPPSAWVQRWSHLVPKSGRVLDLACGRGRHARWFLANQHPVIAVDRDPAALAQLSDLIASPGASGLEIVQADLENAPWPLAGRTFDAVIVTNYLWRPLLAHIVASLAPGGVLIYETFADGNAAYGRPARADFLLQPGELLAACTGLHTVAYEHGFLPAPDRIVQRIAAVRPYAGVATVQPLQAP